MVRRKLSAEEEARLVAEMENSRGDRTAWDFAHPTKLRVPPGATGVLSVRVPYDQLKALRRIAERDHVSMSDVAKQAIESYIAASGPSLSKSERPGAQWTFFLRDAPPTESVQPADRQLRNDDPDFLRPDADDTKAS